MKDPTISLENPESTRLDESGRTPAFFARVATVAIGPALLEEIKCASIKLGGRDTRLCLHEDASSTFHEMIVLAHSTSYYRPHKHLTKSESYHLLEGSAAIFVFDEKGGVTDARTLESGGLFLYRMPPNLFHSVLPLTPTLIYVESRPGPFQPGDSVFPDWAPDGSNADEARRFTDGLLRPFTRKT